MTEPNKPVKLHVPGMAQQPDPERATQPSPPARRGFQLHKLPPAIVFTLLSLLGFAYGMQAKQAGEASLEWPTTTGVVASSRVDTVTEPGEPTSYHVRVSYDYTAAGRSWRGHSVRYHATYSSGDLYEATSRQAEYPAGKSITVYVNPDDPSDAVLIPGATLEGYAVMILGGLLGVFALICWVQFLPARARD